MKKIDRPAWSRLLHTTFSKFFILTISLLLVVPLFSHLSSTATPLKLADSAPPRSTAASRDRLTHSAQLSNQALTAQQQGDWPRANQLITESLNQLQTLSPTPEQQQIYAASLDIQGQIQLSQGDATQALDTWTQAANLYQTLNLTAETTNNLINQAVALQQLGLNPRACFTLLKALGHEDQTCPLTPELLQTLTQTSTTQAAAAPRSLHHLGAVLSSMGHLAQAQYILATLAQQPNLPPQAQAKLAIALGNNLRGQTLRLADIPRRPRLFPAPIASPQCLTPDLPTQTTSAFQSAIACYQIAIQQGDPTTQLQAQLNQASLISEIPAEAHLTQTALPELDLISLQSQLDSLPSSHTTVLTRLKWVQTSLCFVESESPAISPLRQPCHSSPPPDSPEATSNRPSPIPLNLLENQANRALQQAQAINDPRSVAMAYGYLGAIALERNDLPQGRRYTELALQQTTAFDSPETSYLWLWQLGRIDRQLGQTQDAIAAYQSTQQILQNLRADLVTATPDVQFAFRDSVEPVYRELVDLLLPTEQPSQSNLAQARDVIESLQLAELHNFYQQACLDAKPQAIESIDPQAAVVYAITLRDRLAVITSIPETPLQYHNITFTPDPRTDLEAADASVDETVTQLISSISLPSRDRLAANRKLYDWLIRPSLGAFESHNIQTLVFVLDGALREVPIAALHNGQRYLIEDYRVALTPGLQLLSPQSLTSLKPRALAAGVSESVQGRPALPEVANELQGIAQILPTEILLNHDFTSTSLESSIQDVPYNVVHLATHAQFSSKAEQTFLLAWDKRINVNDLDTVLRERQRSRINRPIELLTLSACQTAAGDKRAALGLAGVAMRSGARSTLASLWSIPDKSTAELMKSFYAALDQPGTSKAEALQQAQLEMLRSPTFKEPRYWSAFVLVGNWL